MARVTYSAVMARHVEQSRSYPCGVASAFDAVLPMALPRLFGRRAGVLPAVTGTERQTGDWDAAGDSRTILLADRSTVRETLLVVRRPEEFTYRLADPTGPMKAVIGGVDGRFGFTKAGTGVRVTWAWTIHPASRIASPLMPVVERSWHVMARHLFDELEQILVPA